MKMERSVLWLWICRIGAVASILACAAIWVSPGTGVTVPGPVLAWVRIVASFAFPALTAFLLYRLWARERKVERQVYDFMRQMKVDHNTVFPPGSCLKQIFYRYAGPPPEIDGEAF